MANVGNNGFNADFDEAMTPSSNILLRPIVFWGRESGHRWSAGRIRSKLSSGSVDFAVEAEHLTEAEFGPKGQHYADDEEAYTERRMREQSVEDHQRMLERTESYLWGLGIAGIYHQFERDIREVIDAFTKPKLKASKLQSAKFDELCDHLQKIHYQIKQSTGFDRLHTAHLISNVIKHGEGNSFEKLVRKRPDLFPGHQAFAGALKHGARPDVEELRVGIVEFDEMVSAISMIWPEMENTISPVKA